MILSQLLSEYYYLKTLIKDDSSIRSICDFEHATLSAVQECENLPSTDRGITTSLFSTLRKSHSQLYHHLNHLLEVYENKIKSCYENYDEISTKIYNEWNVKLKNANEILSYQLDLSIDEFEVVNSRLKGYTDWKYPGAYFRPGNTNIIEHLVDLDPLYVFDHNNDLVHSTRQKFNPSYQRRLRYYQVNDYDEDMFTAFPDKCFALSLFYYFFNFKTEEIIIKYLRELYPKIKPGGIVAFTLNDCDYAHNAALTEKMYTCFTPGSRLLDKLYKIGYLPQFEYHSQREFHWIELRVPGEIDSVRGGQCIAKICQKH
jgi:hypothetical protein